MKKKRGAAKDGEPVSGHADGNRISKNKKRKHRKGDSDVSTNKLVAKGSFKNVGHQQQDAQKSKHKSTSLLDKMRARLSGGQFRMLNEVLYTCRGQEACQYFEKDPQAFKLYHAGYQEQMSRWPKLPVEVIIEWLKSRDPSLVVADFGCGDARLAKNVKNKVFSFDLVSSDPSVITGNMAHTPLSSSSVDVAVFCLSLMGTDYPSYLKEAHRVLKTRGWLVIAEVKSRFDMANNGASPQAFLDGLKSLGYSFVKEDVSNKMFMLFFLQKEADQVSSKKVSWPALKPCIYKRR